MKKTSRVIAYFIVTAMLLCGCDSQSLQSLTTGNTGGEVRLNETISDNSKWINSAIPGAIDENTEVSIKDDFYTAVNKDWIVSASLDEDGNGESLLSDNEDLVKERKIKIVSGEEDTDAFAEPDVEIAIDELEHDVALLEQFVDAAEDWESRKELGTEPLRPYIEAIANISSMDELTSYILNEKDDNFTQESFIKISTGVTSVSPEVYSVMLESSEEFTLKESRQYISMDHFGIKNSEIVKAAVKDILEQFGYTENESKKILRQCFDVESHLAANKAESKFKKLQKYTNMPECEFTHDDIEKMQGNYPLMRIMEKYGYDKSNIFYVPEPNYVKYVGKMYKESNLEKIKAYYIVHTIYDGMSLLDRDRYEASRDYESRLNDKFEVKTKNSEGDVMELTYNDEWDVILNDFVGKYLAEPLEIVYISRYCSSEQKQYLTDMTNSLIESYKKMIKEEDWLSEDGQCGAIEKLDFMKKRVLYPNSFESYKDIVFEEGDTLVDMVSEINESDYFHNAMYVNKNSTEDDWDLRAYPTTTINAYYIAGNNSIFIFAGIVASKGIFDIDAPFEKNIGEIGSVVGHEISHAFDNNGSKFDKFGYEKTWWSLEDSSNFSSKLSKQQSYYDALCAAPGLKNFSGLKLSAEVIADMGGVKAALAVAKDRGDFDYDLFFKSFATLWREKQSYGNYILSTEQDTHPPAFLRTNVTLMQYDEFIETYDLQPGDGMYMAPDDRLAIW